MSTYNVSNRELQGGADWIVGSKLKVLDSAVVGFGSGTGDETVTSYDMALTWDGTNFIVTPLTDDTLIEIGDSATTQVSWDVKWYANEASGASYLYFDASDNAVYTTGVDVWIKDDDYLVFGSGAGVAGDIQIEWDTAPGTDCLTITTTADNSKIEVGTGTLSLDLNWFGGDTLTTVSFDNDGGSGTTGLWAFGADDHGVDVRFNGATASNYLLWDESANQLLSSGTAISMALGSQANTAGSGTAITAARAGALRVFSDDGGANVGDSVRGVQSRFLLTTDQSAGTIRALQGQLKLTTNTDVTTGIYTAVQGYIEMAGTHSAQTGATFSCFDASAEIGTALTIDSGGEFFGVHVETTGAGTITNNGTCAAIGITKASGAASWPVGLYVATGSVTRAISVGTYASSVDTGVPLNGATWNAGFFLDDSGDAQTASTVVRNVISRAYFTVDQGNAACDFDAIRGHIKAASGVDFSGDTSTRACVRGYLEMAGATICGAGAFLSAIMGEFWGDGNITGTGKAAGVMSRLYTSAGSTSGTTAAFMATKQWASTQDWPYGLYIDSATVDIRLQAGPCIMSGTTAPGGAITAPKGSIMLVTNGSGTDDRIWINTDGGTSWDNLVAAS